MMEVYEATTNLHIPALKCTCQTGYRFYKDGNTIKTDDREFPFDSCFALFVKHGMLKKLTAEEANKAEKRVVRPTVPVMEREKMPVVEELEDTFEIKRKVAPIPEISKEVPNSVGEDAEVVRNVRGMKVIEQKSRKIGSSAKPVDEKEAAAKKEKKAKAAKKAEVLKRKRLENAAAVETQETAAQAEPKVEEVKQPETNQETSL